LIQAHSRKAEVSLNYPNGEVLNTLAIDGNSGLEMLLERLDSYFNFDAGSLQPWTRMAS
jgi:hypothetical protein